MTTQTDHARPSPFLPTLLSQWRERQGLGNPAARPFRLGYHAAECSFEIFSVARVFEAPADVRNDFLRLQAQRS